MSCCWSAAGRGNLKGAARTSSQDAETEGREPRLSMAGTTKGCKNSLGVNVELDGGVIVGVVPGQEYHNSDQVSGYRQCVGQRGIHRRATSEGYWRPGEG